MDPAPDPGHGGKLTNAGPNGCLPAAAAPVAPHAPRLPDLLVDRPRLTQRLDAARTLALARAPVGYGKTTLVAQWAASRRARDELVAWWRVRPAHGDAATFWADALQVLADLGLTDGGGARTDATPGDLPRAVERALARAESPVVLVVDGLQEMDASGVDRELLDLVRHLPGVRLVVTLRGERQLPEHLYLDLDPVVLDCGDLAFTLEETRRLAELGGVALDGPASEELHLATSGWPEATRAVLRRLTGSTPPGGIGRAEVDAATTEYFQARVLPPGQPADQARLALATSLPDEFTADLAVQLSGEPASRARELLDALTNDSVLLSLVRDGQTRYRWPPGARQTLLRELQRGDPATLAEIHATIARWHRERGETTTALHHATEARDWPLVIDVIDGDWRTLVLADNAAIHRAFVSMPIEELERSPRALALRDSRLNVPDDRLLAVADLPESDEELEALGRSSEVEDVLDTSLAVVLALRLRGALDVTTTYGRRALTVARTARAGYPAEVVTLNPVLHLHVGIAELLAGDLERAADTFGYAFDRGQFVDPGHHVRQDASAKLSLTHAVTGNLAEAEVWLDQHEQVEPPEETWLTPLILSGATAARMLLATDRLELDEATRLDGVLQAHVERDELRSFLAYARGQLAVLTGRASDALSVITAVRAANTQWIGNQDVVARPLLTALEADALLVLGQGNLAREVLAGPDADHPLTRVAQARLALLSGRPDVALQRASDTLWEASAWARHRLEMLLVRAVAAQRSDQPELAETALAQATASVRAGGSLRALATVPRADLEAIASRVPAAAELLRDPRVATLADVFPAEVELVELSEREREVLADLAAGLSVPDIARKSVLSYNTVRTQQRSLYKKLGTSDRAEAVARSRQLGLLPRLPA